jgi:retinol dehydrogenase-12
MDTKPRLADKSVVITGATAGIGLATACGLARKGAYIIGVGRAAERCGQAKAVILDHCAEARVDFCVADLSSRQQIMRLAADIEEKLASDRRPCLDVLINNAGAFSSFYVSTPEGFELQWAVNHLAPFLLTHALMPLLQAAPAGRVVTVSSGSHYHTRIHWKDVMFRRHYGCLRAYKQSKLANVLFTCELNRRLGPTSTVRAYAADPGLVNTEIGLKGTTGLACMIWKRRRCRGASPAKGAATSIHLASAPNLDDELYWKECAPKSPSPYSKNAGAAGRLWALSAQMCGIRSSDYGIGKKEDIR